MIVVFSPDCLRVASVDFICSSHDDRVLFPVYVRRAKFSSPVRYHDSFRLLTLCGKRSQKQPTKSGQRDRGVLMSCMAIVVCPIYLASL